MKCNIPSYVFGSIYYDKILFEEEGWWPKLDKYDTGITKDDWLDILGDKRIIEEIWGGLLAMFYSEPKGASCKAIGEKFGYTSSQILGRAVNLAKAIKKETGCPLVTRDSGEQPYWPILFQGKETKGGEIGTYKWRMRPELYDACEEYGIEKYLPNTLEGK